MEVELVSDVQGEAILEPPRDDERRIDDRDREHEQGKEERQQRRCLQEALDGDVGEREAEQGARPIAHEDARRDRSCGEGSRGARRRRSRRGSRPSAPRASAIRAKVEAEIAVPRREPIQAVEKVDHVHHRDDPDRVIGPPIQPAARWSVTKGNVKRWILTPKPAGTTRRELAAELPPPAAGRGSRRRADVWRRPRRAGGRGRRSRPRNASAGTKMPRKSARPPGRGTARRAPASSPGCRPRRAARPRGRRQA